MHYTHLTKIKAHHIHPQSYMQALNLRGEKNDQEENKVNISWKYHTRTHAHKHTNTHTNLKLYKSKEGKTITTFYTFRVKLSDAREEKKKEKKKKKKREKKEVKRSIQGGLASAWNAFLLNVFNSMGYLRWWAKLFHAKEPEKEKLVLKISVLVLGKSCLFPWTWRRSDGIMRYFRYCGALPWTTFCIRKHLLRNSCLSKGSSLRAQHFSL